MNAIARLGGRTAEALLTRTARKGMWQARCGARTTRSHGIRGVVSAGSVAGRKFRDGSGADGFAPRRGRAYSPTLPVMGSTMPVT